jgi:hypothetical protein
MPAAETLFLKIWTEKGGRPQGTVLQIGRAIPSSMTIEEAVRWIYELGAERLPRVAEKHRNPHRD